MYVEEEEVSDKKTHCFRSILVQNVALNLPVFMQQKDNAVKGLTGGVAYLFKANKVN